MSENMNRVSKVGLDLVQSSYCIGNHWGKCSNGTEATGCGPQETWINCSDIGVNHNNGIRGPAEVGNDDEKRWLVHRSLQ